MSTNNMKPIDVYSDNFDKIKVIDFEKLKQESLRIYKISEKYKVRNNFNKIIPISYSFFIFFFFVLGIWSLIIAVIIIWISHNSFRRKKFRKKFPSGTPDRLIFTHRNLVEIEKTLYSTYILNLGSISEDFNYRILGVLKSNNLFNLNVRAYDLKANILTDYQAQINDVSHVKSDLFNNKIDTNIKTKEYHVATAIEVLNENKDKKIKSDIDIHNEIMKLVKLKDENIISEEEFELAKKKLLN